MSLLPGSMFMLVVALASPPAASSKDSVVCYVWDFETNARHRTAETIRLTDYFEEAVTRLDFYTVLQRREFAGLFQQQQNEKAIAEMVGLSKASREALQAKSADAVFFGKVSKVKDGTEIRVQLSKFDHTNTAHSLVILESLMDNSNALRDSMLSLARQFDPRVFGGKPPRTPFRMGLMGLIGTSRLRDGSYTDQAGSFVACATGRWMRFGDTGFELSAGIDGHGSSGEYVSETTGLPIGETYTLKGTYFRAATEIVRENIPVMGVALALRLGPYLAVPLAGNIDITQSSGSGWSQDAKLTNEFGILAGIDVGSWRAADLRLEGQFGFGAIGEEDPVDPRTSILNGSTVAFRAGVSWRPWVW